tara:strand:+ start:65 stop:1111 length:1047 start_codon:yes stop_codon:yes gene_type:complete
MPRQLSLGEALRAPEQRFGPRLSVEVIDLFASIGGFSSGATQAGHKVAFVAESILDRVQVHMANHPDAEHMCVELPSSGFFDRLPQRGALVHYHGSPPCQKLSKANGGNVRENEEAQDRTEVGLEMVEWFLDLVKERQPATWSMEQVNHPKVIEMLERRRVSYLVAHFDEWGLPQNRTRIVAGTPHLIRRFEGLRDPTNKRVPADVMSLPVPGARIKGSTANYSTKTKPGSNVDRTVPLIKRARCASTQPSLTVIGEGHTLVWTDHEGKTVRQLTPRENATLQGFSQGYVFHEQVHKSNVAIGDAFPPSMAKLLMDDYRLPLTDYPTQPEAPVWPERPLSPSLALEAE